MKRTGKPSMTLYSSLQALPVLLLLAAVSGCSAAAAAPATASDTPPVAVDPLVQAIAQAKDPSSTIQAYVAASAAEPSNTAIEDTYLHQMVGFGLPEMADAQATDLTQRDPQDGLPWAVTGYMNAKRGQMVAAALDMQTAVHLAPADPFVQRTAGQMMAWYDVRADKAQMPADTRASFELLRQLVTGNAGYAAAYAAATAQFQQAAGAEAPAPSASAASAPTTVWAAPQTIAPAAPVSPDYQYYPSYSYYPTYSPFVDSYECPPYWDNSIWWPSNGFIVIGGGYGYPHRDGDHDRDDRGGHDRGGWNQGGTTVTRGFPGVSRPSGGSAPVASSGGNSTDRTRMEFRAPSSPSFTFRSTAPAAAMPSHTPAPSVSAPHFSAPQLGGGPAGSIGGGLRGGGASIGGGGGSVRGGGGSFSGGGGLHGGGGGHR